MTDTNPPEEREATRRTGLLREFGGSFGDEREAEAVSSATWAFLNEAEPDANRRATLWIAASTWIAADYERCRGRQWSNNSSEGARRADAWIRAMCARRSTSHPR
jgi:hypothetical protein